MHRLFPRVFSSKAINPTSLSKYEQQYLSEFLDAWPYKKFFIKDVCYHQPDFKRKARKSFDLNQLTLTHTIQLDENSIQQAYEVIGEEYEDSEYVHCYELIGYLKMADEGWCFSKVKPCLSLRLKGKINVTTMSELQSRFLGAALLKIFYNENGGGVRYFHAGYRTYQLSSPAHKDVRIHFDLVYPLVARECEYNASQLRFEVAGNAFSEGAFSLVLHVKMTLIPQSDGSLIRKFTKRVIKKEQHAFDAVHAFGQGEYPLAKLTDHLHLKSPVLSFRDKNVVSFTTMRHLPGCSLRSFLDSESLARILTMPERLRLVVRLIAALDNQIHQHKIVHRDVKPANILVDFERRDDPRIHYLDLGLSKHSSIVDPGVRCGTPLYVAPEIMQSENSTAVADVYSLALVIWEVFHVRLVDEIYLPSKKCLVERLCRGYVQSLELTQSECEAIATTIKNMADTRVACRLTLSEAYARFEEIRLSYQKRQLTTKLQQLDFCKARDSAMVAHYKIQEYFSSGINAFEWRDIAAFLSAALSRFPDQPQLINEFVFVLQIQIFDGLSKRVEIEDKVKLMADTSRTLTRGLHNACLELNDMLAKPEMAALNAYYRQYLHVLLSNTRRRAALCPHSLDHACELMQKADTDLCRIEIELQYLSYLLRQASFTISQPVIRPLVTPGLAREMDILCPLFDKSIDNDAAVIAKVGVKGPQIARK